MKTTYYFSFLLIFLTKITFSQYYCSGESMGSVFLAPQCDNQSIDYLNKYKKIESYQLNSATPIKTLKTAVHIWLGANGEGCWTESDEMYSNFDVYETWINSFYQNLTPSSETFSPISSNDSKIRIEITGVYFYYNNSMYNAGNAGDASA